jgi:hypothetical protein
MNMNDTIAVGDTVLKIKFGEDGRLIMLEFGTVQAIVGYRISFIDEDAVIHSGHVAELTKVVYDAKGNMSFRRIIPPPQEAHDADVTCAAPLGRGLAMNLREQQLPPGLRDLANAKGLSQAQVDKLARAWDTIRGRRPKTLEEWLPLYEAIKNYFVEDELEQI